MSTVPPRDDFTFLHAADVHLDSPLRGLERYEGAPVDAIRLATREALSNLVQLAIDEAVGFVLIAGDLYDGNWKDYNTGLFFVAQMGRLDRAGIPVFVIAGNHDAESQITRRLRLPPNVHLFDTAAPQTRSLDPLQVAVHGQGFATREVTRDLTRHYPPPVRGRFNIGLLHTALNGRAGHAPYAPASEDRLRTLGYDYWALGHVHQREEVSRDPWIVFPGNLQGRHVRETGAKGATRVTVLDGKVVAVEHVPFDVVRWFDEAVDVTDVEDVDGAVARAEAVLARAAREADGRLAAVRLGFTGQSKADARLRADHEHLVAQCRGLAAASAGAVWVEEVRVHTRPPRAPDAAQDRDDALSGLLNAIDALHGDAAGLDEAAGLFSDLRDKLPQELLEGDDGMDPASHDALRGILDDVKALLVERLLHGAGE